MTLTVHRGELYEYRDERAGTSYYAVSQVLCVLDPDRYRWADVDSLRGARLRGERVHLLYSLLLGASVELVPAPERPIGEIGGYYDAIARFLADYRPVPVHIETPSVWPEATVAGKPDSAVLIDGVRTLVEVKTTAEPMRIHRVQVQMYHRLELYRDIAEMRLLYLRPDGSYCYERVNRHPTDEAAFLNAVSVLRWRTQRRRL